MENKTEIKKANFFDSEYFMGREYAPFRAAVDAALAPARKNDYAEKLKSFLLERSGENKAFLFNSTEEAYFWLFKSVRASAETSLGKGKNEIVFLNKGLFSAVTAEQCFADENIKYVYANHLGNFIAALSEKTCAVVIELFGEGNDAYYGKDFLSQISEICAVRDVYLILDERKSSPAITGEFFGFKKYGIVPDAIIAGGSIYRSFSLGALLTGKRIKTPQYKKEVGSAVCAGALALAEGADAVKTTAEVRGKKLYDALTICKKVKSCNTFGLKGYAETADGKKIAAEMKEKGLKVGLLDNRILFNVPIGISDEEFEFGLSVIKEVLKGAQNPFDTDKID